VKKVVSLILAAVMTISLAACGKTPSTPPSSSSASPSQTAAAKKFTIVTVPKLTSIAWFQRMEQGVKKFASDTGMDAYYTGPATGDAALQAQVIEDLIAKKVDAICVVPFSTEALEPVLKKARDAGILVITHEAAGMTNIDYDIEAFDNNAYGEHFMKKLGELTGGKGQYVQEVGALTSQSHKQWTDAASALQKTQFPNMSMFGDKIETKDDQSISYEKIKEVLKSNPNIAGIQGSAMGDVASAALAVEEAGLSGKIKVVGTSLVSVSGKYIKSGTIDMISFWDPADAGYAMNVLAQKILSGEKVTDGMNLNVSGYESLTLKDKVLTGKAWVDVDKNNVDDPKYGF
jgi:simple sugar transport system substrate-binding protein